MDDSKYMDNAARAAKENEMILETATPCEIDTELARIYGAKMQIARDIHNAILSKREVAKYRRAGMLRDPADGSKHFRLVRLEEAERRARWASVIIDRITREVEEPLHAEFRRRGGWSRYFMVGGGHLHRRGCHTLRPTTMVGWMPSDSGKDESEVIGTWDSTACTKCFPDAPVEFAPSAGTITADGKCTGKKYTPRDGDRSGRSWAYRYGYCDSCGTYASITSAGNLRKHKVDVKKAS